MKTILAALFATTLATTAFASETTHNGQLVRDANAKQVEVNSTGFGNTLGQATVSANDQIGADRGKFSGK